MIRRIFTSAALILFLLCTFSPVFPQDKSFQFKKHTEIHHVKPKKPVRIKLKRLADGKYTWELTGDDVKEIIKIDKQLRKLLEEE